MHAREIAPLLSLLERSNHRRPALELLRVFVRAILHRAGFPSGEPEPHELKEFVEEFAAEYSWAVKRAAPFADILGLVHMELLGPGSKQSGGAFYTPESVANLLAQIQLAPTSYPTDRLLTVCDPTCGSGGLLLQMMRQILEVHGPDALRHWSFTGVDVNYTASLLCAVQMMANNSLNGFQYGEALVFCGDSLRMDRFTPILHASAPGGPPILDALSAGRIEAIRLAALTATDNASCASKGSPIPNVQ